MKINDHYADLFDRCADLLNYIYGELGRINAEIDRLGFTTPTQAAELEVYYYIRNMLRWPVGPGQPEKGLKTPAAHKRRQTLVTSRYIEEQE